MVRHCFVSLLCLVTYTALVYQVGAGPGAGSAEREADGSSWRDHDHYTDGEHNAEFDHEIILGSVQLAEEFQTLEPEEAKRRLEEILVSKDLNGDRYIDKNELRLWILGSFKSLSQEDAARRMSELDTNKDSKVSWSEHLQDTFGVDTEDEITLEDMGESGVMLQDEREMFAAADADGDGQLNAAEFEVFASPEEHAAMHSFVLRQTLRERDADGDGLIDFKEFLGDRDSQSQAFQLSERVRFDEEDVNKDGVLDGAELRHWVLPANDELADEEMEHILSAADADGDGRLAFGEVLAQHALFVGSRGEGEGEGEEGDDDFTHFDDEL